MLIKRAIVFALVLPLMLFTQASPSLNAEEATFPEGVRIKHSSMHVPAEAALGVLSGEVLGTADIAEVMSRPNTQAWIKSVFEAYPAIFPVRDADALHRESEVAYTLLVHIPYDKEKAASSLIKFHGDLMDALKRRGEKHAEAFLLGMLVGLEAMNAAVFHNPRTDAENRSYLREMIRFDDEWRGLKEARLGVVDASTHDWKEIETRANILVKVVEDGNDFYFPCGGPKAKVISSEPGAEVIAIENPSKKSADSSSPCNIDR